MIKPYGYDWSDLKFLCHTRQYKRWLKQRTNKTIRRDNKNITRRELSWA